MELHQINGKEISHRNDNLDEYELQRQELIRLLRSAESEDKRTSLSASLSLLEGKKQQFQHDDRSTSASTKAAPSSPPLSSSHSRGSARRQTAVSLKSLNSDDEFSSDGEGDEQLGYFSSPYKIINNRSPGSISSTHGSNSIGNNVDAPGSVPRINLSGASLNSSDGVMSSSSLITPAVLATLSPDLADAPLSGRKSVPTSARPASARWKGTLELRTIPEFAPFNRPLSGANKKGDTGSSSSIQPTYSSDHRSNSSHASSKDSKKRIVVLDADELSESSQNNDAEQKTQQDTPMHSSSSSSSASLSSSAFMPYSSTPKNIPPVISTNYNQSQNLGARCSPILELSLNIDIEDVWGSCVDPLRPPSSLLIMNASSKPQSPPLCLGEEKQNMISPSPRNRKFVNSPPPRSALNFCQKKVINPPPSSKTSTSTCFTNSVWITTGGFPQKLRIRLRRLATVHRVQLVCSGNPLLYVAFDQLDQHSKSSSGAHISPTNRLSLPRMEAVDILSDDNDTSTTTARRYHSLPAMLYVLDMNTNPKNNIIALELDFVGAFEPFCIISHLRIWGKI